MLGEKPVDCHKKPALLPKIPLHCLARLISSHTSPAKIGTLMTLMPPDITPEEEGIILRLPVLKAEDFRVTNGANLGDAMAEIDELVFDDSYGLSPEAETRQLAYTHNPVENSFAIASTSSVGTAGAPLHLDCAATFMLADGDTIEILVLVEISRLDQGVEQVFLMPLAALAPKTDYRLIGAARDTARTLFAEAACVSFLRGTRITLSDGRQVAVEDLTLEDRILTRDCGVQTPRFEPGHRLGQRDVLREVVGRGRRSAEEGMRRELELVGRGVHAGVPGHREAGVEEAADRKEHQQSATGAPDVELTEPRDHPAQGHRHERRPVRRLAIRP